MDAIDLQSKSDSHQTDASLSLPDVRQGHRTGLRHRKKHRLILIGLKLASSPTGLLSTGVRERRRVKEKRR